MSKTAKSYHAPTHDEIAVCARRIYEIEGRPEGKAMEHWLQAEAQLTAERKAQAGMLPAGKPAAKPLQAASPASATARGEGWQTPARPVLHRN
jgi:Protein of unknown function (DUF2934)